MPPPALPRAEALTETLAYAASYLQFRQRYDRIPGVQVAVWADGELQLNAAFGVADESTGAPLTTEHLFRIASHSKTFTATLVLQQAQDGTLRLDDTAARWLPALQDLPIGRVTIRELLGHGAGLFRDSSDGDFWQLRRSFPDTAELWQILADTAATTTPANAKFKYTNIGYGLLGLVLEAATGLSYEDLSHQRILDPLGLKDTGVDLDPARATDYAAGHSSLAYAPKRSVIEHVPTGALAPATGFHATAADLVRYFAAHTFGDDTLLDDDAKRRMQQPQWQPGKDAKKRYGLGLSLTEVNGRTLIGHGGGYPGHITCSVADPRTGLAVSVLTNCMGGPAQALAHAVVRILDLGGSTPPPATDIDPRRFTGRYASLWGVVDIAALGGTLYRMHPEHPDPTDDPAHLEIVDAHTLRVTEGDGYGAVGEPITFTFDSDSDDKVTGVRGESRSTLVPFDEFTLPDRILAPVRPE